jgi:hypothetical protein
MFEGHAGMSTSAVIQFLDELNGDSYLAIASALKNLDSNRVNLARAEIKVVGDAKSPIVIIEDGSLARRTVAVRPGSNRELNQQELDAALPGTARTQMLDHLQASSFPPMRAAVSVFEQYKPDLTQYKITLVRQSDSFVVLFADKKRPASVRGSMGQPGFEVELAVNDLRVRRSNFVR